MLEKAAIAANTADDMRSPDTSPLDQYLRLRILQGTPHCTGLSLLVLPVDLRLKEQNAQPLRLNFDSKSE